MPEDPMSENDELLRIARIYFARLASRPVPRGLEPGAPFLPPPHTSRPRRALTPLVAFACVAAVLLLVIVGVGHVISSRHGTSATPPPARTAATPPPGGPVPPALTGDWLLKGSNPTDGPDVIFSGNRFEIQTTGGTSFGRVAVRGSEIDFYNGDVCGISLPGGVGRYQWTLQAGILHFTPLIDDPCGGRTTPLANQSYAKQSG
jgi:hypothetical protein